MIEPSARELSFKPPICPKCGHALEVANEKGYDTYVFNPETGRYVLQRQLSDCDISCSKCGYIFPYEAFPDGICNYFTEVDPGTLAQARNE